MKTLPSFRLFEPFEWMLAGRYLRSRREEAFISVIAGFSFLGIMLGVATLIIVMAVMNGFRGQLLDKILGINGHVVVQPIDTPFTDYTEVARRIAEVKGVRLAMPFVEGQVLASGPSGAFGTLVRGVTAMDLENIPLIAGTLRQGTLDGFDSGTGIAIGVRLAQNLGVAVGDRVTLVSPKGTVTALGTTPRVKAYEVSSIYEIGMSEYDSTFVFMPIEEAQRYFSLDGVASAIDVFLDDPDMVGGLRDSIGTAAGRPNVSPTGDSATSPSFPRSRWSAT
ncbi:Lipoprotein-releasing system transmembrane protein LolE [Methylobrevis pamukkalensis]|uniref:Lipoprotein-releasing system transmembrane protein LolE n=1 Tax=Methylobrevis pamukkalensis TaxID=1439726 RepID=A0A1E3H497_9HYPH|nr:Lipoprotein-releasing system transmembrane protein LolE [Methylobrevis pamukkalensis]